MSFQYLGDDYLTAVQQASDASTAASRWWAFTILHCSIDSAPGNEPYDQLAKAVTSAFGNHDSRNKGVLDTFAENLKVFAENLTKKIGNMLLEGDCVDVFINVGHDGPCDMLAKAAKEAGLNVPNGGWPLKMYMMVNSEIVAVSVRRTGPFESVWSPLDKAVLLNRERYGYS